MPIIWIFLSLMTIGRLEPLGSDSMAIRVLDTTWFLAWNFLKLRELGTMIRSTNIRHIHHSRTKTLIFFI